MNIYRGLGLEIPAELYEAIKKKSPAGFIRPPAGFITPEITGHVGDYFEWLAAGLYDLSKQSSAMHSAKADFSLFYYGFDQSSLYFRVDGTGSLARFMQSNDSLVLYLTTKPDYRLIIDATSSSSPLQTRIDGQWRDTEIICRYALNKILEIAMPLASLNIATGDCLFVSIVHQRDSNDIGRWPTDAAMKLYYAGEDLELDTWLI